jgi:pimeloyl-ACP methyl ester carboxylesterase
MPNIELRSGADDAANGLVDRGTLLVGAAGARAAAGLTGPARAAAYGPRPPRAPVRGLTIGMPRRFERRAAGLAAACMVLLCGLAFAGVAQAQTACPPGVQCGTVPVPLDRANPAAGTIDIAYALLPHSDTSRPSLGTIVPNPGGPGGSASGFAGTYLKAFAPLRARRDLLLVDVRGTGRSGPLTCPTLTAQAARDPLSIDERTLARLCGADLGARGALYDTAAAADDIDAVRATLGFDKLDLWGDSYGTFLMPVYAARHPDHVRSIVLDGAFPITQDPWGRDEVRGARRVIDLVCRRTHRCSGARVLRQLARLAGRLRRHPVHFSAHSPIGAVRLTLGERELANLGFGFGDPRVFGLLPAAVDAARRHDFALLKRMTAVFRIGEAGRFFGDPSVSSIAVAVAVECHDYPRPYSLADPVAQRRAEYERGLAALDPAQFRPFSASAWLQTDIDAGPKCLDWPADPTAGSPLRGLRLPDVPVLVQSGDLDTNTPIEQGRPAAAQFRHSIFADVANAGHTPDLHPCGVAMALDFIRHLTTDPNRCRHAGHPPVVVGRPALRAVQLPLPRVHAAMPVRRAVAVALATLADERALVAYSDLSGTLDALRSGTYIVGQDRVRFVAARVVTDATATGTETIGRRVTRTTLRLRGRGVPPARLALRSAGRTTRVTGTVAGQHVALHFASTH